MKPRNSPVLLVALAIAAAHPLSPLLAQVPPGDPAAAAPASPLLTPELKGPETSYDGYHFKILTSQGKDAPAGKYDYVINGHLIAGFALVAWPADYGKTGVMTFIVNHYGTVYQQDLGPDTAKTAAAISEYNPNNQWKETTE